MLGCNNELIIKYNDKEYNLRFTFKFLKNLYTLVEDNPMEYIKDFLNANENEIDEYLINILYSMVNGKIDYKDLIDIVTDESNRNLILNIGAMILTDINEEDIFIEEDEDNIEDYKEHKKETVKDFIRFWDTNFYVAKYQLHMTYNQFLNSTPREMRTLTHLHRDFLKNIMIEKEIDILKAKNKANEDNNQNNTINTTVTKVKVTHIKDLFS